MTRIVQYFAVAVVVVLFAVPVYSQTCPTPPQPIWHPLQADEYHPDPACIGTSGPVSTTTLSCGWGTTDYEYYSAWPSGKISYTFSPLATYSYFEGMAFFDFDDPADDWYNQIVMYASVTSGGITTTTGLFQHDGTQGDLVCSRKAGFFTAQQGDTVTITIEGSNFFANKVASSQMYIWGYY